MRQPWDKLEAEMRQMLAMLRSRGLREFMLWDSGNLQPDDWDDMADVIDQVWLYVVDACSTGPGDAARLAFALDDELAITSTRGEAGQAATVDVDFTLRGRVPPQGLRSVNVIVEAGIAPTSGMLTAPS